MADSRFDLEAWLRVPFVDPDQGFDVAPDGSQVAYSWNRTGQWEVYLLPLDGSGLPRQVTSGAGAKFAPRWSPDGRSLAYVLDLDGSERFDVYVCELATGRHTNLTPNTDAPIQPSLSWSPDGARLAFISAESGRFDTYVLEVHADRPPSLLLDWPHPDGAVHWSPDGRWLAVVMEAQGQEYWTVLVSAEGGAEQVIAGPDGPLCARDIRWSPDAARVVFCSDVSGVYNLGIYELATGEVTWVTEGGGEKEQPDWSPDGRRLAYVARDGPATSLVVLDLEDGSSLSCQVEPGVCYRPRFTPDGEGLVSAFDNPRHPTDLWLLSLRDGALRQLTDSLEGQPVSRAAVARAAMPVQIHYPSLDGARVPALLYRPPGVEGALPPAVVVVHGGPNWLAQVTWDPLIQHMVGRGWAVLAPNYRGSTGYGRAWQWASRFDFGGGETEDVVAGADYLVREGLANPARIAVTGRSWGGYLTMTVLTGFPDRWAGGSAVVPFLNWFTGHLNSREDLRHWDIQNFGHPVENARLYYERSPFFFLHRVAAPVQLICGAHDVRCPASESTQARDLLLAQGRECELVLYEDEGHDFLKTENVVDAQQRRVDFLARVLGSGQESRESQVDRLFAAWDRPDSPGCAVGIIQNGRLIYQRGYGMANLEHDAPISSRTAFRIASTSKQFTALCVALLAEQGRLSLDDDVRRYAPELPVYEAPITIRHLMHHTSGLRDYLTLMELASARDEDFYTADEALDLLVRQSGLNFVPGSEYLYSNSGYYLLGLIVQRVSGQSLREFAQTHIFEPLGMTSTHFHDDHTQIVRQRATGYSTQEGGGWRIDETTLDLVGDGGLFTTVEDLFRWDQNWYHNRLGRGGDELICQAQTPGQLNGGEMLEYGFGLRVSEYRGLRTVSHGGAFVGFRAELLRFPEQRFSVICLANLSAVNPERLARQVADIYLANQFEERAGPRFRPLSSFLRDRVGVYWSDATQTIIELSAADDALAADLGGERVTLVPVGESELLLVDGPLDGVIRFEGPDAMHLCLEGDWPDTLRPIEVVSPSVEQLAEYVGEYTSPDLQVTYDLTESKGRLQVQRWGAPARALRPGFQDLFWVDDVTLRFTRDEGGRVTGLTLGAGRVRDLYFVRHH